VRHLLDHTGGLDDVRLWQVFTTRGDPDSPLASSLGAQQVITVRHRPGARFSYSNTGYLLLGMLIERVTGVRYEEWLDEALLAPLGMQRSTFAFTTQQGANADPTLAMGHFGTDHPHAAFAIPVRPASQFTTTAEDMATFARFLMSDGVVNGRQLVDAGLLRAMAVPTGTEAAQAGLAAGYAHGLARRERWGITGKCHLGNMGTFRAILCVYPEHQRAFFASYNSDPEQGNFSRVDSLFASALGVPQTDAAAVTSPGVDPAGWNGWYVVRPNRFQQFAYLDELMGVTRISWNGETLVLRPLQGATRSLEPVGGALFRLTGSREATHVIGRSLTGVDRQRWNAHLRAGASAPDRRPMAQRRSRHRGGCSTCCWSAACARSWRCAGPHSVTSAALARARAVAAGAPRCCISRSRSSPLETRHRRTSSWHC
jgi:CubicO group peptidase (beta-lactamase class C family)